jgi:hypothetical protein
MVLGAPMSLYGREVEVANDRFRASQFAEPGLPDWPQSGTRYGRFGHG